MKEICFIIIFLLIILIIITKFKLFESFDDVNEKLTKNITSGVDGNIYKIQEEFNDKFAAANMIAELNNIVLIFIKHLTKKFPNKMEIINLYKRYEPNNILEGTPNNTENNTSYSLGKGDKLVLCLRNKRSGKLHKKNLLMFVVLHELAHLMSESYGHNAEFIKNFKFLLNEAIIVGIYKKEDYRLNPVEYCGMILNSTPI